jgi:monoamine oxidase
MRIAPLLALLLSNAAWAATGDARSHVVIVGAGLAGLSAAFQLDDKFGIEADVYEASDHVGGRAKTITGPEGMEIDVGGQYIGGKDKDILQLIKRLGLVQIPAPALDRNGDVQFLLHDASGNAEILTQDQIFSRYYDKFKKTLIHIKLDQIRLGVFNGSLLFGETRRAKRLDGMSIQQYLEGIQAPPEFIDLAAGYFSNEFGAAIGEMNALQLLTELKIQPLRQNITTATEKLETDLRRVLGGAQQIPLAMEKRLPGKIHKNHRLTAIESSDQKHFKLYFDTPDGPMTVDSDFVILTVPFNILSQKISIKIADFPAKVRKTIDHTHLGQNSKLILFFSPRLWETQYHHAGQILSKRFLTWESAQSQDKATGALTVYFSGPEDFSDLNVLRDSVLIDLEKAYPGISKACTGMSPANWPGNPFSLGAYSGFKAPGQWSEGWPEVKDLRVGNLLFAGEETAGPVWVGYMNGAVRSGFEAAKILGRMARQERAIAKAPSPRPLSENKAILDLTQFLR